MNKQVVTAILLTTALALTIGLGAGYWFASQKVGTQVMSVESANTEREVLFYRSPMDPSVTSSVPAKDAMGMDYVPVYADDSGGGNSEPTGTVRIDPVTIQNIGVRIIKAKKQVLSRDIRALGRVDYNEELISKVHPKIDGWIEKLFVSKTGEFVKKNAMLLSIYSPQLVASQQEYLLALKNMVILKKSPFAEIRSGAEELVESSRKRLEFFDVPSHQIEELTDSRMVKKSLHIQAPASGIVMNLGVRKGDYVSPKTELYMLADLSRVWVYVEVYEYELPWITIGDKAEMTIAAAPGRTFHGKVSFIYPYMERKTRTAKVRLEFDNSDLVLKPEMFANVILLAGKKIEAVVIPSEAVVRSGNRDQVFIARGQGKFEPREVKTGLTTAGLTQILAGLKPGENVVTSSQFLIDSESKLREATAKMMEAMAAEKNGSPEPDKAMDDMDMSDMTLETMPEEGGND